MEAARKVNKHVMETPWTENEMLVIDELNAYPFMLEDVRRIMNERAVLKDLRKERDMPAMVARYDGDQVQRSGVSDPMFNIVAGCESIDRTLDELLREQEDILARHTRLRHEIETLPSQHAAVIRLRYFDRMTMKKMVGRIGYHERQVRRLHRDAIMLLTKRMDDWISKKKVSQMAANVR
jgi:DNA-directed RNA polymerase specialized sigma24 family protein